MGFTSDCFGQELSGATLLKLLSFLFWSGAYLQCAVSTHRPRRSPEWCSRAVTLLHGSVATLVGMSQCGMTNLTPYRLTCTISICQYALMVWSWGYFAFDFLWCLIYWTESLVMLCHHAIALGAITIYMQKQNTGCTFACTLTLLEITNPLLQTRWFLREKGYERTTLYITVELLYLSLFLLIRGVLGTYLIVQILDSQLFDLEEKLISLAFYIVSLSFIYEVSGYTYYKHKKKIDVFRNFMHDIFIDIRHIFRC